MAFNTPRLNPKEVKVIAEQNRWNFKPDARIDKTIYSISRAKPGASSNLSLRIMEALPGSISRYLAAPILHSNGIPLPETQG
ncbi:MAG: hypothetical protein QM758_06040 [Armatimonas sp.]